MEFNPNKMKSPVMPKWATYIPDRHQQFKIHKQQGHAKNAFQYRDQGILYEYEEGMWVEKFRLEKREKPTKCELCGSDTHTYVTYDGRLVTYKEHLHSCWIKGKYERKYLCTDCSNKQSRPGYWRAQQKKIAQVKTYGS